MLTSVGLDLNQANALIMAWRQAGPVYAPPPRQPSPAECGTESGYVRHRRAREPQCEPCRLSHNAANQARAQRRKQAA
jgi:hypothetical protein